MTAAYEFEQKNRYFDEMFNTPGLKWLGQNTNHYPLHPAVKQAMLDCIEREEFHAYAPPAGIEALRRGILADMKLDDLSVLVTDGAIEGLYHACRTLCGAGDVFVTTEPGWKWPISFARDSGATVVELPIYEAAQNYRLTPAQLAAAVTRATKLIYLVDPNNPLGVCYSAADIEDFARIAKDAGAYLIHDCTYWHFADAHTPAARFYPERTLTTYSFSKWLGLAGLRVGALIAHPAVIELLAKAPPNNLGCNVLSQRAAIAGLAVKASWFPEVQRQQRHNQRLIRDAAAGVRGLATPVYPSHGNFMIIDCAEAGVSPEALCDVYRKRGIMIRQGGYHTERYAHRFVKVSTTVPVDWVESFCALLPQAVEEARGINERSKLF